MVAFNLKNFFWVLMGCFMLSILASDVHASVIMNGTRIIYHAKDKSVDVNLKNKSEHPYVVQLWFDEGDMSVTPSTQTNIPFFATPTIFKIQSNATQIVRIAYTKAQQLPQDRESVFYFNFLEIPPSNIADNTNSKQNKMLVMFRNRLKMFYRPDNLRGSPNDLLQNLEIKRQSTDKKLSIEVHNPSPFFASLSQVVFASKNKTYQAQAEMIPPFSSKVFTFDGAAVNEQGGITLTVINDQGARISESYLLEM